MPIPALLLGAIAAGTVGLGATAVGVVKMKDASETNELAKKIYNRAKDKYNEENKESIKQLDSLGKLELKVISDFTLFSDLIARIQNRPEFDELDIGDTQIPKVKIDDIKEAAIGANILVGGLGGAAVGTAAGFAAAGVTTSAVMALGTASTGTAIATLSGAAATNATLAAIGGGTIATGGGGMAAGAMALSGATLGIGLLIGGTIFAFTGNSTQEKADSAFFEAKDIEKKLNKISTYLKKLSTTANEYSDVINKVKLKYDYHVQKLEEIVIKYNKTDWNEYTQMEKDTVKNAVMLVSILYNMCKVNFVIQQKKEDINKINHSQISEQISFAEKILVDI